LDHIKTDGDRQVLTIPILEFVCINTCLQLNLA
jgi:hypothetical protein